VLATIDAEAPGPQARRAMHDEGGAWVGVAKVAEVLRKQEDNVYDELGRTDAEQT